LSNALPAPDPGLQPERTSLAWTRTSLGFLANGVLLLIKHIRTDAPPISLVAAGLATVVTLFIYLVGRRRHHLLARRPLPARITPTREVFALTASVLLLVVISLLSLSL
jgi:uncharacterized membrane protein YidH (DUF202 family)